MELWTKEMAFQLIPSIIIMIGIALVLRHFLKDKEEKIKLIPLQIIGVLLIVLEILKQSFSIARGYDLYHIPLHFCSLFIFLIPIFAFYKGKYKEHIRAFTIVCCSMLMMFMLVYPELIYSGSDVVNYFKDFFAFHTVTMHNLILLAFFIILSLNLIEFKWRRDMIMGAIGYGIYSVIAGTMAQILKTNYNNFYRCSIDIFRGIQDSLIDSLGWFGQLIYVVVYSCLIIIFSYVCYWTMRGVLKLISICAKKINGSKSKEK